MSIHGIEERFAVLRIGPYRADHHGALVGLASRSSPARRAVRSPAALSVSAEERCSPPSGAFGIIVNCRESAWEDSGDLGACSVEVTRVPAVESVCVEVGNLVFVAESTFMGGGSPDSTSRSRVPAPSVVVQLLSTSSIVPAPPGT